MSTRITVNGREYSSLDEMPPDVRQQYERAMRMLADRNNNGVPDIVERSGANTHVTTDAASNVNVTSVVSTHFVVHGKPGQRLDDLPPDVREAMHNAFTDAGGKDAMRFSVSKQFHVDPAALRRRAITGTALVAAVALTIVVAWFMLQG